MITQQQITYFLNMVDTMRLHQKRYFGGDKAALKAAKIAETKVDEYSSFLKEELGIIPKGKQAPQDNRLF